VIRHRLAALADVDVAGEAASGLEAPFQFASLRPDVVLLDLVMPEMGGEDVLHALLQMNPDAHVVIVSSVGTRDAIERCLAAEARSFLQKPFEAADLARTLGALAGEATP
jgi:two-component system chemotaxis response regulator CheY